MEPVIVAIVIISASFGVVASAIYNTRFRKIKRKVRQAEFKRIYNVKDGELVTIAGNVVFHNRYVEAPLSDRQCVYYHATVERKKSSGKNTKWVKEIDEASCVDFLLDDGSDVALVEANAVEGCLEMDANYRSGAFRDADPKMEGFLRKYNFKSTGPFGLNKSLRYKEGALEKHEYVIVCGTCFWEDAQEHGFEDKEKILVIRATSQGPVYISDVKDILTK